MKDYYLISHLAWQLDFWHVNEKTKQNKKQLAPRTAFSFLRQQFSHDSAFISLPTMLRFCLVVHLTIHIFTTPIRSRPLSRAVNRFEHMCSRKDKEGSKRTGFYRQLQMTAETMEGDAERDCGIISALRCHQVTLEHKHTATGSITAAVHIIRTRTHRHTHSGQAMGGWDKGKLKRERFQG